MGEWLISGQFGLQGVQLGASPDPIYMGLAGTDSVDNEEIISFFQPDKEAFLEYDIAKLVKRRLLNFMVEVETFLFLAFVSENTKGQPVE